jgi:hypothetical protein
MTTGDGVISPEDLARAISETSNQNGFTAQWEWAGDVLNLQFTRHNGRPGPQLTLSRNNLRQTIAELDGKKIGPLAADTQSFAWGRFWRAVRQSGRIPQPKHQEFGYHGR